jgi:hypothetical protein
MEVSETWGIFRVFSACCTMGTLPRHGETWISALEFNSLLKAEVLMSYGNSPQPGSPHRPAQLPYLTRKELRKAGASVPK